ncbi:Zn(II)2Cys6 transcription factor domain-containing protein [Aspergillus foveolatus]|uniref:Zn(II)2Cys6 transcription factor domain-containing protein n=1 Tax=Aspergillus foveolatus TaxID=210207 RepID=UPI003CCD12B6
MSTRRRKFTSRSLTGCRTCRARHKKCDESLGVYNNCISTGRKCDGYDQSRLPITRSGAAKHAVITLALQMGHLDRAVYHAASILGANQEDSCQNQMRLSGENLSVPRHRFALEWASRSFSIPNRRRASHDLQLREVVLLRCLVFVISESLLGQYDCALQHLRGGLWSQDTDIPGQGLQIHSPHDVCQTVHQLLHMEVPFLAKCWSLSTAKIEADYDNLHHRQRRILSYAYVVKTQIQSFYSPFYHQLTYNERRRTCLFGGLVSADLTSEYVAILDFYDSVMARFSERPTITLDNGVIPTLWMISSKCPDYSVRLRAIRELLSWPHSLLAPRSLKADLQADNQILSSLALTGHTTSFTQPVANWSTVRAARIIQ